MRVPPSPRSSPAAAARPSPASPPERPAQGLAPSVELDAAAAVRAWRRALSGFQVPRSMVSFHREVAAKGAQALAEVLAAHPRLGARALRRPPPLRYRSALDARRDLFARVAAGFGLSRERADQLLYASGAHARDPVTGLEGKALRFESVERAIAHARLGGENVFYVDTDLRNLGGLNEALGHSGADEIYAEIALVWQNHLESLGGRVVGFRHGGDEVSAVIITPYRELEDVHAALAGARARIEGLVAASGLGGIRHPKHPGDPTKRGTGIYFGVTQITGDEPPNEVFGAADLQVERQKGNRPSDPSPAPDAPPELDGVEERPRPPGPGVFASETELRRAEFRRLGAEAGLTAEDADLLFVLAGADRADDLTGFEPADCRLPTLRRALLHAAETKEPAFYVEADVRNLGGLNASLGHTGANRVFAVLAACFEQAIRTVGGDACLFRHGGDELSAVVIGPGLERDALSRALDEASVRIADFVASSGLADIPHPKHPQEATRAGTGLVFGVAPIHGDRDLRETLAEADRAVERQKRPSTQPPRSSAHRAR